MKNLFIDSNIWLSLYHFTNDDLEQFGKLKDFVGNEIRLFVPRQVKDEIMRNRDAKIKDALAKFKVVDIHYPVFSKNYSEYESFSKRYKALIDEKKKWDAKIEQDIKSRNLPADIAIQDFLNSIDILKCDQYVNPAFLRYNIGNPPGKDKKYGDAINWLCLLDNVPTGEDLYFISADQDYCSELYPDEFNSYLQNEWEEVKQSKIYFYKNLVPFLNEHYKEIQLKTETYKQDLIARLEGSRHFIDTHGIIAELRKYNGWTDEQIEELCVIAETNSQVSRIIYDEDVFEFYKNLLVGKNYDSVNDSAAKRMLQTIFQDDETDDEDSFF